MFPGVNPRQMQQAMKRMGIKQHEIDAVHVDITLSDGRHIIIARPNVVEVDMMGESTLQITGDTEIVEADATPDISEEDIVTVMEQTQCSREVAEKSIAEHDGDLAQAIMAITNQ
jgi:nascent polypeptide-associated complex subunit alpha